MANAQRGSEVRLRAACDRCHELKNRCARSHGPDSRCERCERLDLDCTYSTGPPMGRPTGSRTGDSTTSKTSKSRARGLRPKSSLPRSQQIPAPAPTWHSTTNPPRNSPEDQDASAFHRFGPDADPMASPSRCESLFGMNDTTEIHTDTTTMDFPMGLMSFDDASAGIGISPLGHDEGAATIMSHVWDTVPLPRRDSRSSTATPDSHGFPAAKQLLKLQDQLRNLVSDSATSLLVWNSMNQDKAENPPPVADEDVLQVTKSLLEIVQAVQRLHPKSGQGHSEAPVPESTWGSRAGSDVTILQIAACYASILQMLDPIVCRLERKTKPKQPATVKPQLLTPPDHVSPMMECCSDACPSPTGGPAFSLGCFTLASQPMLNAVVVSHTLLHMVQNIRLGIDMLTVRFSAPGVADGGAGGSPVMMAARAVMSAVREKEDSLIENLKTMIALA